LNQGVQPYRNILSIRPDIIIKKKDRIFSLIDIAIPSDRNVIIQKEAEKKLKYKNLCTKIQLM
jgi:hypothetical protein